MEAAAFLAFLNGPQAKAFFRGVYLGDALARLATLAQLKRETAEARRNLRAGAARQATARRLIANMVRDDSGLNILAFNLENN